MNMYEDLNRGFEEKYGLTEEILDERTIKGKTKKSDKNMAKLREANFNKFWNGTDLQCPPVTIKDIKRTPSERVYVWFYANRTKKDRMPGTHQGTECYPKYDGNEYPVVIYKKKTDKNGDLIADGSQYSVGQLSKMAKQWLQSFGEGELPEEFSTVYDLIDYNIYEGLQNGNIKAPNKEEQNYFIKYYTDMQQETSGDTGDTKGDTTGDKGGDKQPGQSGQGGNDGNGEGTPGDTTTSGDTTTTTTTTTKRKRNPEEQAVKIELPKEYNRANLNNLTKGAQANDKNGKEWVQLKTTEHKELIQKISDKITDDLKNANSDLHKEINDICANAHVASPFSQAASYSKSSNEFYEYLSEDADLMDIFERFINYPSKASKQRFETKLREAKRNHLRAVRLNENKRLKEAFDNPLKVDEVIAFDMFDKDCRQIAITEIDEGAKQVSFVEIDWASHTMTSTYKRDLQWGEGEDQSDIKNSYFEFDGDNYYLKNFSKTKTPWLKKRWQDFYKSKDAYVQHIIHGKDLEFNGDVEELKKYLSDSDYEKIKGLSKWIEEKGVPLWYSLRFNKYGEITFSIYIYDTAKNKLRVYMDDRGYRARYILADMPDDEVYALYDECTYNPYFD